MADAAAAAGRSAPSISSASEFEDFCVAGRVDLFEGRRLEELIDTLCRSHAIYSTVKNLTPFLECLLRCVMASPRASDGVLVPATVRQVDDRLNYVLDWRSVYRRLWCGGGSGDIASAATKDGSGVRSSALLANLVLPKYGEWILQSVRRAELARYGSVTEAEKKSVRVCGQFLSLAFDSWDTLGRVKIFQIMASVINKMPKIAACGVYEMLNGHLDYTNSDIRSFFICHLLPLIAVDMGIFCPSLDKGRVAETWEAIAFAVWVGHLMEFEFRGERCDALDVDDDDDDYIDEDLAVMEERCIGVLLNRLITNVDVRANAFAAIRFRVLTQKSIFGPFNAGHIKETHSA